MEDIFSVSLFSYRTTFETLGELEKAKETVAFGSCSNIIYQTFFQTSTGVSIKQLDYELEISGRR